MLCTQNRILAEQASLHVVETGQSLLSLTVVGLSRCGVLEMVAMLVKEGLEINHARSYFASVLTGMCGAPENSYLKITDQITPKKLL